MNSRSLFWKNKIVLVTGGTGFLGKHITSNLNNLKARKVISIGSKDYDLREYKNCKKISKDVDLVIHLAASVGGIGYNREHPAKLFDDNILMGINMMRAARENGVKKFVTIGTVCAYPKYTPVPFKENDLWNGYPEETNAPYGLAKKMLLVQAQAYRLEYGFNAIYLLPVNLYGPGDNFDPKSSHVIPALIKKFVYAKKKNSSSVTVWGTGKATREFLYVEDAANGILLAAEKYNKPEPVNLGNGLEIPIRKLVNVIKKLTNYRGNIIWDTSKPDGQPRRRLDVGRAKKEFGFEARTPFQLGLKRTIEWYLKEGKN